MALHALQMRGMMARPVSTNMCSRAAFVVIGGLAFANAILMLSHKYEYIMYCYYKQDGPEDKFSLDAVAPRLTELLGQECKMAPDCKGDAVNSLVSSNIHLMLY
jgi:hypothetical protein